ncbi:SLC13 family permease [Engelhardtia mirabilis]|uniref:Sodium-dependent dicarboxylate transporter SdcS n=1 Tax=Engelhardtia mirabilis TaxID=2528011 RepID=A0A518BDW8_9BACT|nr:Sodium-dependent dicarboxylate transporter SdcS [Planctomycetes bacterium Pla133]QDU99496.1 Sodium-dependent dicarboxylate transporter SdcS [Planctomycetes bacterium Pla86]
MTSDVALLLGVLALTIFLIVSERLRVDVVAMLVMVTLPWLGLLEPEQAFSGFSRGAVVSIIAVMIMGHGLERTGMTSLLAGPILDLGGRSPRRLLATLLASISGVSAFMQNIGAAALFLPVGVRIGREGALRTSQLLMPMGFAAILGGTLSMVGSSPLIVVNDLVSANGLERFDLFAVTPIGLALVVAGIAFFVAFGSGVLPERVDAAEARAHPARSDVLASWSLLDHVEEAMVPADSSLVGLTRKEASLLSRFGVHVLAVRQLGRTVFAPDLQTVFAAGQRLALMGRPADIERMVQECGVRPRRHVERFPELRRSDRAGLAELLVAPRSELVGKSVREIGMRRNWGVEPLSLLAGGQKLDRDFGQRPLEAGDLLLVQGPARRIREVQEQRGFVLLTPLGDESVDHGRGRRAIVCFVGAIALGLAGVSLPVALFTGAVATIVLGVVTVDQAYQAVSWRTVFLLAGLIPLGIAMRSTGAADYLAGLMFHGLEGAPVLMVLGAVALLASVLSLFMSSVAATIVVAPLAMNLGVLCGIDQRAMALLVGICAQNSFLLPTHQVNALLMAPGGYRNSDYLRAGGALTVLFLPIAVGGVWLLWT